MKFLMLQLVILDIKLIDIIVQKYHHDEDDEDDEDDEVEEDDE
jgi:hypothetical protein